jgi:hypothetical protein
MSKFVWVVFELYYSGDLFTGYFMTGIAKARNWGTPQNRTLFAR